MCALFCEYLQVNFFRKVQVFIFVLPMELKIVFLWFSGGDKCGKFIDCHNFLHELNHAVEFKQP